MLAINITNINKNYGFKNVLKDFSLAIKTKDRIAIVGKNGSGKTTLFKMIKGIETCDSGTIAIKKDISIGFLQQIPPKYNSQYTVKEVLMTAFQEIVTMEKELRKLEIKMADPSIADTSKIFIRYGQLQEEFRNKFGYEIDSELAKICSAFNISEEMQNQSFNSLSGGQKTIVHLVALLLEKPDILLLDEPTNHLDIKALEWLEEYLSGYPKTVIISSHDRYFLDKVVHKIAFLEEGKCKIYHGNYSYFLVEKERELMAEFQNFKTQQKQIQAMKEAIKRYRDWGTRSSNEKFFKAAKNLEKRLERIEIMDKPQTQKIMPLKFVQHKRSGNDVVRLIELSKIYKEKIVLDKINFEINYGENLCLMGSNGSGKTTLLKIILGEIQPTSGKMLLGSHLNIGYLSQQIDFMEEDLTVLAEFKRNFKGNETQCRATLAKFYFNGENVFKKISTLSGGEKVRLKYAQLIQQDINFLILDEPTNHIDIETREILEESLQEFKGTLLFVSHDRYFVNKLAKTIVVLEKGKISYYLGNYNDYKEKKKQKKQ